MNSAPCIVCGNVDAVVTVTLDADHEFTCKDCDATFSVADVENVIEVWSAVLGWLKQSPFRCVKPANSEQAAA